MLSFDLEDCGIIFCLLALPSRFVPFESLDFVSGGDGRGDCLCIWLLFIGLPLDSWCAKFSSPKELAAGMVCVPDYIIIFCWIYSFIRSGLNPSGKILKVDITGSCIL